MHATPLPLFLREVRGTSGFTLIELMVAVGILLLALGGGMVTYRTFERNQRAQTAAYEVQQFVRTAQLKARVKDTPATGCESLISYHAKASGGVLTMVPRCRNNGVESDVTAETITKAMPSSISVTNFDVYFQTLGGGTNLSSPITIEVSNATGTPINTYQIEVGVGGNISEPTKI